MRCALAVLMLAPLACRSTVERPTFEISIAATNLEAVAPAARDLSRSLGIDPIRVGDGWAMLLSAEQGRGMTWELFARPHPRRRGAMTHQPIVPHFIVEGHEAEVLSQSGPEGFRFEIERHPEATAAYLAWLVIECHDLDAQRSFYTSVLGLEAHPPAANGEVRMQEAGANGRSLVLRPDQTRRGVAPASLWDAGSWMSFSTHDLSAAQSWFESRGVRLVRGRQFHWSFFASDVIIADADGNPLQVVEYHGPRSWREAGRRALLERSRPKTALPPEGVH